MCAQAQDLTLQRTYREFQHWVQTRTVRTGGDHDDVVIQIGDLDHPLFPEHDTVTARGPPQRRQQLPVVHGQIARYEQARTHRAAESGLGLAQLPPGDRLDRPADRAQVLGEHRQLVGVPAIESDHDGARGRQARITAIGRELLGEGAPAP